MPYKNFASEVLTSSDVDTYLMQQTVMTFATEAARDSALSGDLVEGMIAFTEDTDSIWYYTGSAWKPISTPWADYTPTWTNVTVGNGTLVAKSRYVAGDIRQRGYLTFGSTTAFTGTVQQDIDNSETSDTAGAEAVGRANDSGTAIYRVSVFVDPTDTQIQFASGPDTLAVINATTPHTWATGDSLTWDITIPIA